MVVPTSQVAHGLFARRQLRLYGLRGKVLIDLTGATQPSLLRACGCGTAPIQPERERKQTSLFHTVSEDE